MADICGGLGAKSPFFLDTNTQTHELRVMLKNVTISLPEETLRAVRIAAAHDGVSMSKWLGRLVERSTSAKNDSVTNPLKIQKASVQLTDEHGNAPSKEWMNDRESLRRFERSDLRFRSYEDDQADGLRNVAEPASPDWPDRPVPSGDE
jgi:hypothetical protein